MFGYININQKELSEESKKIYQAYYCGLCQKLKTNCGTKGQMLLSYDLTFLNSRTPRQSSPVRCTRRRNGRLTSMRRQSTLQT